MGSSEEKKLVQMVHDFIEPKSPSPLPLASTRVLPLSQQPTYQTLQEILGRLTDAEIDVLQKISSYMRTVSATMKTSSTQKWLVMRFRIDGYDASLCKTSWVSSPGCPRGDYEYIDVLMKEDNGGAARLMVDIDFKAQFELARPTPTYTKLLNSVPSIFVGSEKKLRKIILMLCSAAKQSLKERALHIPPWRRTSYVLSKWLSVSQRVSIPSSVSNKEVNGAHGSSSYSKWVPPMVNPKPRNLGGCSGLTIQLSNISINCC